jgi:thiol-disulfide isomerase/thioredoxin
MKAVFILPSLLFAGHVLADDILQKNFPVEAARVLAWRANETGARIAEVKADGQTIRWLDAAGKIVREKSIVNPEGADGATYFREVFKQLAGDDWRPGSTPPDNAASAFWQGAELAGGSRLEATDGAVKLLAERKAARPADASRLAGVLAHGVLPSLAASTSLDGVLVARAAAWLCVGESMAREPLGAAWAPVLFLGGREEDAEKLWAALPQKAPGKRVPADRFWDHVLRRPSAKDSFLFAARPENRAFAAPALMLPLAQDATWSKTVIAVAPQILGADYATRFIDYGPTVGGEWGEKSAGSAAEAWQRTVRGFSALPGDITTEATLAAKNANAATGPLIPTPHTTLRDLVRHHFDRSVRRVREGGEKADDPDAMIQLVLEEKERRGKAAGSNEIDFTKFKTADEFWTGIESLRGEFKQRGDSPEDQLRMYRAWLAQRIAATTAFLKAFPNDARRHEARLIQADSQMHGAQAGVSAKPPTIAELAEIAQEPEASAETKGEATFLRILLEAQKLNFLERHNMPPFQKLLSEFLDTYANHRRTPQVANMQMELIQAVETPAADAILKKLAAHPMPEVAMSAKQMLASRAQFADLKKKPIELKFTAADGSEVNLAKLRGKVVLLDFWASWCGPCMAEVPHVVAVYEKLHAKGFEIIGVNLDQDRAAMDTAIGKTGMTWKQNFDGKGWQNELAQRFGIRSIPATWLFDKQGKLREIGLRGQELENGVERLLKE